MDTGDVKKLKLTVWHFLVMITLTALSCNDNNTFL